MHTVSLLVWVTVCGVAWRGEQRCATVGWLVAVARDLVTTTIATTTTGTRTVGCNHVEVWKCGSVEEVGMRTGSDVTR